MFFTLGRTGILCRRHGVWCARVKTTINLVCIQWLMVVYLFAIAILFCCYGYWWHCFEIRRPECAVLLSLIFTLGVGTTNGEEVTTNSSRSLIVYPLQSLVLWASLYKWHSCHNLIHNFNRSKSLIGIWAWRKHWHVILDGLRGGKWSLTYVSAHY